MKVIENILKEEGLSLSASCTSGNYKAFSMYEDGVIVGAEVRRQGLNTQVRFVASQPIGVFSTGWVAESVATKSVVSKNLNNLYKMQQAIKDHVEFD